MMNYYPYNITEGREQFQSSQLFAALIMVINGGGILGRYRPVIVLPTLT